MSTFNRGQLLRLARSGKLVCVGSYHFDDMTGSERSAKELPVRVKDGYGDFKEGFCNLFESDFKSSGCAYQSPNGTITLIVHSNCNYTFRVVKDEPLTTTLRDGRVVLAKLYKHAELCPNGEPQAVTYANRTQAERAAQKLGADWSVTLGSSGWGGVFYVAKRICTETTLSPDDVIGACVLPVGHAGFHSTGR